MCMRVLPACVYVHHMRSWQPRRSEEGIKSSRSEVNSFELLWWWWELNLEPLPLTNALSFQSCVYTLNSPGPPCIF